MAKLNTSLYSPEEDTVFSEDSIEKKLYERVSNGNCAVHSEDDWEVFYHFSPLRQNILCWYPFKKDSFILEIGTNFGELTGLLLQKAKQVTSCEKTMIRAKIIYERFKDAENLEIIAGDFRKLTEGRKYDYIILNGTLENAGEIFPGENPYLQMLSEAKRYLKEEGIILIAADNRLGLRCFSGAPDGHKAESFAGIDGYQEGERCRSFDRKELGDLCGEAGLHITRWFYPFPDYKFSREIFTETSINRLIPSFADELMEKDRFVLFSEQKVQRSLADNQIAQFFCNSFLIEATGKEDNIPKSKIDYIKLSNDRDPRFSLYTVINQDAGKVYKIPYSEEGKEHLIRMCSRPFEAGKLRTLPYQWDGEQAICELLHTETLLDQLSRFAEKGSREAYWEILEELKAILYSQVKDSQDYTPEFEEIFGEKKSEEKLHGITGITIDCVAGNIYLEGNRWIVIDYEWTFDCPVPAEYILWRTIYQLQLYSSMRNMFENIDVNQFIGINDETKAIFMEWENHFENRYVGIRNLQRGNKYRIQIEEMQAREKELTSRNQELYAEKDELTIRNQGLLAEKDELIIRNQGLLAEKDELIIRNQGLLVEKDELTIRNQGLLAEKDELTREKKELSLQKKRTENELRVTAEALRQIQESGMYRFSLKYYKVRDKLFPEGSRRQNAIKAVLGKGRTGRIKSSGSGTFRLTGGNQIEWFLNLGKIERMGVITTPHTMYVAKLIARELERVDIKAEISIGEPDHYDDIPYIIICPQFVKHFPAIYIAVQMEQTVSSRWFDQDYFVKLQNSCAILDYSLENIDFYQQGQYKDIYRRVYYVPIDYYPEYYDAGEEAEKEYDVLFYGDAKSCERRRKVLDELSKEFRVKICSEVFGEDVYREISKTKVLVNIHYYEGALLETTRIYETLSLNTCVIVSENSKDKSECRRLEDIIDFVEIGDVEQLKRRIRYWVEHDKEREAKIRANRQILEKRPNAFAFFFQRFMLAYDRIDFERFYRLAGDYVQLESDKICLSLPESTIRRKTFDQDNKYGFVCFPGLRHQKGWVGAGMSYKMIFMKAIRAGMKELMICEDDVIFPPDFADQIRRITDYLHSRKQWSVFSGMIADVGKVKVTDCEQMGKSHILRIDHMVSMVFNIYHKEIFEILAKWNPKNRDVHQNAIDRYLESKDLTVYVQVPFLVGHNEELDSSVWGFSNVAYTDLIHTSEDKLLELAAEFQKENLTNG